VEEIRRTVDEQLQFHAGEAPGESFRQVSERLEAVHTGLGEMRTLAAGWRPEEGAEQREDARNVARYNWILLERCWPDQYQANVATRKGAADGWSTRQAPGPRGEETDGLAAMTQVPVETTHAFWRPRRTAMLAAAEAARRQLEHVLRLPPATSRQVSRSASTTDFGISSCHRGLYAEVLRRPGLRDAAVRVPGDRAGR